MFREHVKRLLGVFTVLVILGGSLLVGCSDDADRIMSPDAQLKRQPKPPQVTSAMNSPTRIALGEKGKMYVSDFGAKVIWELKAKKDATITGSFPVDGYPLAVAWADGLVLVGNASTSTVDVYQASGWTWLRDLGGPGAVSDPTDIAVDVASGRVYVLDGQAGYIKVFDLHSGAPLLTISGPGTTEFSLTHPTGIAFDPGRNEILVSDYGDPTATGVPPRIKIFADDGSPVVSFSGRLGLLGQRFSFPQGLAVDAAGRILFADALAGEVHVLNRDTGETLEPLGTFGSGPGELWLPLDVVVDGKNRAYVTNNRPRRVEVFELGG